MAALLCATSLVVLMSSGIRQAAPPSSVESDLIAIDNKFDEAREKRDPAALETLLTDDFLQIMSTGVVRTKAEILKAHAVPSSAPAGAPALVASAPYNVQTHGDTAVMTHRVTDGTVTTGTVMHVFVKQQGSWKMASWATVIDRTTEISLNASGGQLMIEGKTREAIEILKMNVHLFPNSWNAYDSLGQAYAAAGETALAIQNYEQSVQMNPKNESGVAALKKLKDK
jgi:tetratricopeptide (TPR) repeat protein